MEKHPSKPLAALLIVLAGQRERSNIRERTLGS
jgi:hypothetical protein